MWGTYTGPAHLVAEAPLSPKASLDTQTSKGVSHTMYCGGLGRLRTATKPTLVPAATRTDIQGWYSRSETHSVSLVESMQFAASRLSGSLGSHPPQSDEICASKRGTGSKPTVVDASMPMGPSPIRRAYLTGSARRAERAPALRFKQKSVRSG